VILKFHRLWIVMKVLSKCMKILSWLFRIQRFLNAKAKIKELFCVANIKKQKLIYTILTLLKMLLLKEESFVLLILPLFDAKTAYWATTLEWVLELFMSLKMAFLIFRILFLPITLLSKCLYLKLWILL